MQYIILYYMYEDSVTLDKIVWLELSNAEDARIMIKDNSPNTQLDLTLLTPEDYQYAKHKFKNN